MLDAGFAAIGLNLAVLQLAVKGAELVVGPQISRVLEVQPLLPILVLKGLRAGLVIEPVCRGQVVLAVAGEINGVLEGNVLRVDLRRALDIRPSVARLEVLVERPEAVAQFRADAFADGVVDDVLEGAGLGLGVTVRPLLAEAPLAVEDAHGEPALLEAGCAAKGLGFQE